MSYFWKIQGWGGAGGGDGMEGMGILGLLICIMLDRDELFLE